MKKKKLIALDLDGTALTSNSKLSEKTISTVKKITKNGHHVAIVTGRPWRMAEHFYQALELNTPTVNFNGGLVHLPYQKWHGECEAAIEKKYVLNLLEEKSRLNLEFISVENKNHFQIDDFRHVEPSFFGDTHFREEHRLTKETLAITPNSILVSTQPEKKETLSQYLKKELHKQLDVNPWGGPNGILEIIPAGVNKAYGVQKIADYLKIPLKDTIAFGDELNDIELLKTAGLGVAMANAREEIKEVADDITAKTNDENGVADYLENIFEIN